ncbi:MAG: hypothetical protein ISS77_03785, partial [Phycisphaerae bacterium]|nr:hypothetical protein [Phycisphaerae bacterium]
MSRFHKLNLYILLLASAILISQPAKANIPTETQIQTLRQKAASITTEFDRETFDLRMICEFNSDLSNLECCPKLNYIAKQSRSQLDKVIKAQQQIKAYIENYSRDDWETRFGKTNLW